MRLVSYKSASHGVVKGEILEIGMRFATVRVTVAGNKFYRKGHVFMVPRDSEFLSLR